MTQYHFHSPLLCSLNSAAGFLLLTVLVPLSSPLAGQDTINVLSSTGQTSQYSYVNPASLPLKQPSAGQPPQAMARPSVLPQSEYDFRKQLVPPRIPTTGPRTPYLDLYDTLSAGRSPVPSRSPVSTLPTLSFDAIPQTPYQPPSPNLAAGPDDLLEIVNSAIAQYTRSGQLVRYTDLTEWFATEYPTVCPSGIFQCVLGDTSIRYDQIHGRFLMTLQARDYRANLSYLLISVSNGATYASGWKNWVTDGTFEGSTPTNNWADFPQVGYDQSAVYITTNQFSRTTNLFQYARVRIFKKSELYNTATTTLTYSDIFNLKNEDGTVVSTLQAPILRGRYGVGTSQPLLLNASDAINANYLTLWRVSNVLSATPTVTRTTLKGIWPYNYPASAPQLGTSVPLETGPASLAQTIQRDGIVFTARNSGYFDEPSTVTYDRIDTITNKVTLQARWVNGNFFYPAYDIPASLGLENALPNNLAVGTTTDGNGNLTYPGITNMKAGEAPFEIISRNGAARWGDYFGGVVDPINGGLWLAGQYAKTHVDGVSRYGTWITYYPWTTSQRFTDVLGTAESYHYINVLNAWKVTNGCTTTTFCPTDPLTRGQLAALLIRSIYGDKFTYPQTPYFTDAPANHPFFPYIQKLRESGITVGCTATLFCPEASVTRRQVAVFIIRAKFGSLFGESFSFPSSPYFTDVAANDPTFPFLQKFRELGITRGCAANAFCPDLAITREQAAVLLVRAFLN